MLKKLIGLITTVLMCASSALAFTDTKGHWAEAVIDEMAEKGYVNGVGNDEFAPERLVTQAEFSKLLNSIYKIPAYSDVHKYFTDVSGSDWYKDYVLGGYCISNPYMDVKALFEGKAVFNPNQPLSRMNAAYAMLCIYDISSEGAKKAAEKMADSASYDDMTRSIVGSIVLDGLMQGDTDGNFNPQNGITRAELCVLLKRAEEKYGNVPCEFVLSQINKIYENMK